MPIDWKAEIDRVVEIGIQEYGMETLQKMGRFMKYIEERSRSDPDKYFLGMFDDAAVIHGPTQEDLMATMRLKGTRCKWTMWKDGQQIGHGVDEPIPKDLKNGFQVFCNHEIVEMNDHTVVPTIEDAKARIYLHAGMMMARFHKAGKTAAAAMIHQTVFNFAKEWPFKETPLATEIEIGPLKYEIRKTN